MNYKKSNLLLKKLEHQNINHKWSKKGKGSFKRKK